MTTAARLGRELVAYALAPPASDAAGPSRPSASALAPSHAAVVTVNHPNASAPVAALRSMSQRPSASSWSVMPSPDAASSLMVHADAERPLIQAHIVQASSSTARSEAASQTCQLAARLHPPEVVPTLAVSPSGSMLAAGSVSGRLYIWHLASGQLLASLDAHFRRVTCLEWTADERALVSASEDARILVWSLAALTQSQTGSVQQASTSMQGGATIMPFAVLTDHVQEVTSIALSSSASRRSAVSSFPASLRILSASRDGSVKLWDVRTRSLVATWSFQGQVTHLAADVGFRAFFTVVRGRPQRKDDSANDRDYSNAPEKPSYAVHRVDLYGSNAQEPTTMTTSAAAMTQVADGAIYRASDSMKLTALRMSIAGTHLLIGTSDAQLLMLDVSSSAVIRTVSLLPPGLSGKGPSNALEVVGLTTLILNDPQSSLQSGSGQSSRGAGPAMPFTFALPEKLQRTSQAASPSNTLPIRLEERPIRDLTLAMTPPSLRKRARESASEQGASNGVSTTNDAELLKAQQNAADLKSDNERLRGLLERAQAAYATLYERVVQDAAKA